MNAAEAVKHAEVGKVITVARTEDEARIVGRVRYDDRFPDVLVLPNGPAVDKKGSIFLGVVSNEKDLAAAINFGKLHALVMGIILSFPVTGLQASSSEHKWSFATKEVNWMGFCPHYEGRSFLALFGPNTMSTAALQEILHRTALATSPATAFTPSASDIRSTLQLGKEFARTLKVKAEKQAKDEKPEIKEEKEADGSAKEPNQKKRRFDEAVEELKQTANDGQIWFVEGDRKAGKRRCSTRPPACKAKCFNLVCLDKKIYVLGAHEYLGFLNWSESKINMSLVNPVDAQRMIAHSPPKNVIDVLMSAALEVHLSSLHNSCSLLLFLASIFWPYLYTRNLRYKMGASA